MRPRIFVLTLAACAPNPAFDPAGPDTGDTPTTGAPPTPTSSSTGAPTTTTDATTTDATTTTSGDESTTTTTDASTTTTDSGTSSDDDTGAPATCWDQPPDNWPAAVLLDKFMDTDPADPELAPDGLSLVYIATSQRRPFRSTRASLFDPFPNGAPITTWSDPNFLPGYPTFALGNLEIYTSSFTDIYVAKFKPGDVNSQYSPPMMAAPPINTGWDESHPNVTQDGTRLLIQRDDGPALTPNLTKSWHFYEYHRAPNPQPLDPFTDAYDVTPIVLPLGFALCPALSPDGRHLFFSSTDVADITKETASDVVAIYHAERPTLDDPWGPATPLTSIPSTGGVLCPSSVSADGCALAYIEFPYSRVDTPYSLHLVERPR